MQARHDLPTRELTGSDLESMNLPFELWNTRLAEVPESARTMVSNYLKNIREMARRGAGLILGGDAGVGKTGIASLILKRARANGYSGYFTSVWALRDGVRNRVPYDGDQLVLDRCRSVDVLVLDGLKPEDINERERVFGVRDIEELLQARAREAQINILTTRLSARNLEESAATLSAAVKGSMLYFLVEGENKYEAQNAALEDLILHQKVQG
jgi:DNA replication protein DnaC